MRRPPSSRRRGLLRLLVLITAVVVLVSGVRSVIRTSDTGPDTRLAYVDKVRPHIDASTQQGAALAELREGAASLGADGLRRSLDTLVASTEATYDEVAAVSPPPDIDASRGLLLAALKARAVGVQRIGAVLSTGLTPDTPTDQAISALVEAGGDLGVSDRAYNLFVESLPKVARGAAPASSWVGSADTWDRASVSAFVASLRASASVSPVHDVGIVTVVTDPAPVGKDGEAEVIPQTKTLRLQVVVANLGNAPEKRVAVEAVATSAGGMNVGRQFVDLEPGQRKTVELRLTLAAGDPVTVTVAAKPVPGEANLSDNEVQPPLRLIRR